MEKQDIINLMFSNFLNKTIIGKNNSDQHLTTLFAITF
jgi:hypothetical protein